eukprot:TRINITY_DN1770_c0_g2_i4.p1 TRINITY_DN1770_c0_g2~~TRINITY_DN1770_c0_g2_i4.p1  ORF type:complete len:163 (+),score=29.37 TRINITY_DN1770_c0_g2_i4:65-553(+)
MCIRDRYMGENRDTERISHGQFEVDRLQWITDMKELMPRDYRYRAYPMFFNIAEPERIKSIIVDRLVTWLQLSDPKCMWCIGGKIFALANTFNSIRVILAVFTAVPEDEVIKPEGDEDIDEDEDGEGGEEDEEGEGQVGLLQRSLFLNEEIQCRQCIRNESH